MPEITLTFSDEEWKALEWDIYNVQEHFQYTCSEKARKTMDTLVKQNSNLNPKKLAKAERKSIIQGLNLETAKERTDKEDAQGEDE